ncbi:MAG: hypothetical protein KAX44_03640, partial [Candidatus Brocadiae bacterium]|nr:hypothetical protein [Candidatus Brocadiia bacterium]
MDEKSDTGAQTGRPPYASALEGWAGLGAIGLLAVLSVLGAFLGADRAKAMFNSAPLALFWVLLVGLVAARLLRFARLVRLPGLLPLYLGPLLILLGSMYGSATGHSVAGRLFGSKKIPRGYMLIPEVVTSDEILDRGLGQRIARLPFGLRLKDFWIEYYEPRRKGWDLVVVVPGALLQRRIEWEVGHAYFTPHTDVRLRVLNYLDSAWPV